MIKFSQNTLFKQSPSVLTQKVGDRVVLLNPNTGKIYSLNDTASFLWNSLSNKNSFQNLIDVLYSNYDISVNDARKDIKKFLYRYLKYNLIITV